MQINIKADMKKVKSVPCSSNFVKAWNEHVLTKDNKLVWSSLLRSKKLISVGLRPYSLKSQNWEKSFIQIQRQYLNSYAQKLQHLSKTLFDAEYRGIWFNTLKKMSGYSNFQKRDGSIANCCWVQGKISTGAWFSKCVKTWYQNIPINGPTLNKVEFPSIQITKEQLIGCLRKTQKYCKAFSVDCINQIPFVEVRELDKCCKGNICQKHKIWIDRLLYVFSKQFWTIKEAKNVLTGRIILLNKDHPEIPQIGRFRPIRVASNIIKLLESYLLPELVQWTRNNLRMQYGFVPGLSCEQIRYDVFSKIYDSFNWSKPLWGMQVDLSNAYNTVNLVVLKQILVREKIWNDSKLSLWEFIAANATSVFNNVKLQEQYGVAQGSLLSPFLFDIYINDVLVEINRETNVTIRAYADDIVILSNQIEQLVKAIHILQRFCSQRYLKVNKQKSEIIQFATGFKYDMKISKSFIGYPVKNSAKYLGVWYNKHLNLGFTLSKIVLKENFIFYKLYYLLKKCQFREKLNLWQIFIAPLYRMVVSICGPVGSDIAGKNFAVLRTRMRASLKRFCLCPKQSPVILFDSLIKASDWKLSQLQKSWIDKIQKHSRQQFSKLIGFNENRYEQKEDQMVKSVHPEIEEILKIINRTYCSDHENQVLSIQHLEKHKIIITPVTIFSGHKQFKFIRREKKMGSLIGQNQTSQQDKI